MSKKKAVLLILIATIISTVVFIGGHLKNRRQVEEVVTMNIVSSSNKGEYNEHGLSRWIKSIMDIEGKEELSLEFIKTKLDEFVKEKMIFFLSSTNWKKQVHLVALGDDLLHDKVINSGKKVDGSYDYSNFFSNLSEEIKTADIAVINQETIMGGAKKGYSGYPRFNSPEAIGKAIYNAGFDVVLHANNHVLDMGIDGIKNTLNFWKQYPDMTILGIHESVKDYENISVVERNGIKIAMLNYTYGFNGNVLNNSDYYMVETLSMEKMEQDIKKAKQIADFIIVYPHWGDEYVYHQNKKQETLAKQLADLGVDLIIGSHPHVLQPIEWIKREDGGKTLVFYSLGNYISSMDYTDRMLGGMADIIITKRGRETYIEEASIVPVVTHYERGNDSNFSVYKLSEYTKELAEKHYILKGSRGRDFSLERLWSLADQIVGTWIK